MKSDWMGRFRTYTESAYHVVKSRRNDIKKACRNDPDRVGFADGIDKTMWSVSYFHKQLIKISKGSGEVELAALRPLLYSEISNKNNLIVCELHHPGLLNVLMDSVLSCGKDEYAHCVYEWMIYAELVNNSEEKIIKSIDINRLHALRSVFENKELKSKLSNVSSSSNKAQVL